MNISARSLGDINVQLVMEVLGGGGHLTMAATQLPNLTIEQARTKLVAAIKEKGAAPGWAEIKGFLHRNHGERQGVSCLSPWFRSVSGFHQGLEQFF